MNTYVWFLRNRKLCHHKLHVYNRAISSITLSECHHSQERNAHITVDHTAGGSDNWNKVTSVRYSFTTQEWESYVMVLHYSAVYIYVCHHVCKWTICASGCRIKHHQRKLQLASDNYHLRKWNVCTSWMKGNTISARCKVRVQGAKSGCKVQRSGHKVQRSGPALALVGTGCSNNMQLQPPPPATG